MAIQQTFLNDVKEVYADLKHTTAQDKVAAALLTVAYYLREIQFDHEPGSATEENSAD